MGHRGIPNPRWLLSIFALVSLIAAAACGGAAPAEPVVVEKEVVREVIKEVPVEIEVEKEVVREVVKEVVVVATAVPQGAIGAIPVAAPTATPVAAAPKAAAKPAVDRLKFARETSTNETNDPSLSGRADLPFLLPMYEGLLQFDQFTDSQPMLATEWDANEDFTSWTFKLQKGVNFHRGWGEVTAKDVVHTMEQERRKDHFDARGGTWRALIDKVEMPAGPDGYEVVFRLTKPEPIMTTYMTTNYTTVIRSKAQWDKAGGALSNYEPNAAGIKAMQEDPIGTGPYRFAERAEAQYIRYESPEFQHWRITPDFAELQIFFVAESSTRLAMLVAKEVNSAEIPRDLQAGAISQGMTVITGTTPSIRLVGFFGGNFLASRPEYDPKAPLANVKVREAMNRAINRDELNKVFLGGRAELMMQTHSHAKFPGWEPTWPDRFQADYGYDPKRAKELLAEAGYPNGFSITQHSYPRPGLPEMEDIGELVNGYWKAIGINAKFEPIEVATQSALRRNYGIGGTAWLHTGSFTEPTRAIYVYHYDPSRFHGYDDQWFFDKYQALEVASTAEERDNLIREMGDYCWKLYCTIPLFWIPYEFMVNPNVIADWKTPGVFSARDFEYVKAVR